MGKSLAIVTGAGGEMGHLLIPALRERGVDVVAVDLVRLPASLAEQCIEAAELSVLDTGALRRLFQHRHPDEVFHLAAVLSSKAEREPDLAHAVNVEGTAGLFRLCREEALVKGRDVKMIFPSSIAVYGLPDARAKAAAGAIKETEWNRPAGVYGCNKLYCEMLGTYLCERASRERTPGLDFRSIRFPGLISAETLPTGGTSDYAPEMIHAAAQGKPYACFVSAETRLPFMTMPDGIRALLALADAPVSHLSTRVYNLRAFSPTAGEIRDTVLRYLPSASITFRPVAERQTIVDTWPGDVDDSLARRDWGHAPRHGIEEAIRDYLVPRLLSRYMAKARA